MREWILLYTIKMKNKYILGFFIGLLDGNGSIQVNHWKKRYLQYRIVIKLKWDEAEANKKMLEEISKIVGGKVIREGHSILWVENNINRIKQIINIFDNFSPLTTRLLCQIKFMKSCMEHNNVEKYFNTRDNKYDNRDIFKPIGDIKQLNYWNAWISGFIEAEGCFSIRKNEKLSFSVGQKYDRYLLAEICNYFNLKCSVSQIENFYSIETYSKESLNFLINHIRIYPLMGEKSINFIKFLNIYNNKCRVV